MCTSTRTMSGCMIQIIGMILGGISVVLTFVITLMNQWRVSTIVETNPLSVGQRVDGQWVNRWEGLWFTCVTLADTSMQCMSYESMVSLTTDLKAARILLPFALMLAIISFIIALVGMLLYLCCCRNPCARNCLLLTGGIGFLLAAILILIPVIWIAVNISYQYYDPKCKLNQIIQMGEAMFLAFPTILFLLLAGLILCFCHPTIEREDSCESIAPQCQQTTQLYCQQEKGPPSCEFVPLQKQTLVHCQQERRPSSCELLPLQKQTMQANCQKESRPSSCEFVSPVKQSTQVPCMDSRISSTSEYIPEQQHKTYECHMVPKKVPSYDSNPSRQQHTYVNRHSDREFSECEDILPQQQRQGANRQLHRKISDSYTKSLYI